ncbi:hypothetical protein E05_10350 [Plautia stali symbiont]|nr:hypothetical protein E05_10350 [Plautia stali symbiont]
MLHNFSLTLAAGEHLALLGPTGCGKSSLLALITRGWEAQRGTIRLNGIDLAAWDEASLRQRISVVTQRVHLFSQTLLANLLLAAPQASDAQLIDILQRVGLAHLTQHSEGLNAWMGEGGRPLVVNCAGWRLPVRCCTMAICGCWMSRPKVWMPRPSSRFSRCYSRLAKEKR